MNMQPHHIRTVKDILKIVRGVRNGFYYGAKVRFMHSIVISILFMKGSLIERFKRIVKLALEHGIRIGVFVGIYKTLITVLKRQRGGKHPFHSILAGAVGGFIINLDGESAINQQITFYVFSRALIGGLKVMQDKGWIPNFNISRFLSILGWGLVMTIYDEDKSTLQYSLQTSMNFLYTESDTITDWTDFVPVYVPETIKNYLESRFPKLKSWENRHREREHRRMETIQELPK